MCFLQRRSGHPGPRPAGSAEPPGRLRMTVVPYEPTPSGRGSGGAHGEAESLGGPEAGLPASVTCLLPWLQCDCRQDRQKCPAQPSPND